MRSRLWTRRVANALLISLLLLTAAFGILGIAVRFLSVAAGIVVVLAQAAVGIIVRYMPLSGEDEARHKMQAAMSQYVILDSLLVSQPDRKGMFLNRVINRMRQLASAACFREEEIIEYLGSTDVGERFAALASVQWQWRNDKSYDAMPFFTEGKQQSELPGPSDHPGREYFPQLLKLLICDSWDRFQNYHAMVAMWSMVPSLGQDDKQCLFERVLDRSDVQLDRTNEHWKKFREYLEGEREAAPGM